MSGYISPKGDMYRRVPPCLYRSRQIVADPLALGPYLTTAVYSADSLPERYFL
jgi:hypothetical protein